ncbi:MAG TPA: NrfD/PsrC family molybdoenzyme membrane anchor subunit [Burkholderiales bacterium]|nr:NrfD/PsrC family molybdoenzyme membrane anchor subunit [Burkholderiales bacterium]
MAETVAYRQLGGPPTRFWGLLALLAIPLALGAVSYFYMEHYGHIVTGMDNQIVWGMPHVFAVFMIVAASGALNVASTASVFGKTAYKPIAPLSALLAVSLLVGGLTVLVLDLGRSDRLIVAMTHFNFTSIFTLNVFLYNGFIIFCVVYLWFMLERRMNRYSKVVGMGAFIWRLMLTTGTGSIFGFLVAREAYDTAILAPMFIVFSFAYGTALFIPLLLATCRWDQQPIADELLARLKNLLGVFVAASLYFVTVYHLTKLYMTQYDDFERFVLLDGGVYTFLFWVGEIALGGILPLILLFRPRTSRRGIVAACALVVIGGLAQMYVTIIGGEAYPQILFPGMIESSSFFDGVVHPYMPSAPEVFLGLGGVALAATIVVVVLRALALLPARLDQVPQA